jgi:hypothetical protein
LSFSTNRFSIKAGLINSPATSPFELKVLPLLKELARRFSVVIATIGSIAVPKTSLVRFSLRLDSAAV